jgi:hypothetical protein
MLPKIGAGFRKQPVRDRVCLCGWICDQLFTLSIRHTTLARSRSATDLLVYVIVLRYFERPTA